MHGYFLKELTYEEIINNIRNSKIFFKSFKFYKGTNDKHANNFLNMVLDKEEQNSLHSLLHSKNGWYNNKDGMNSNKLKLTAYAVGFTHDRFSYNKENYECIKQLGSSIKEDEQEVLISAYLKQKLVTNQTFLNNNISRITLYRGIKDLNNFEKYYSNSLESWTLDESVAKKFSGGKGYILIKEFQIDDIFAYKKSVFKNTENNRLTSNYNINRENECIVENRELIIDLIQGKNIFKKTDLLD